MKKAFLIVVCTLTTIAILSGGPVKEYRRDRGLVPYIRILMFKDELPNKHKLLIDSFIKQDQVQNLRIDYYKKMTTKN